MYVMSICVVLYRGGQRCIVCQTQTSPTLFRFTRADLLTAYECCTCRYRPALVQTSFGTTSTPQTSKCYWEVDWWFQTSRWVACVLFHVQQRHLLVSRASTFICFISFGGFKTQKRLFLFNTIYYPKYWPRQHKKTTSEVFFVEILTRAAQKDYFWCVFRRNTDSGSAKRLLLRCFPSKYRLGQRKKTTFEVFSVEILTQAAQKDYFWGVFHRNTDSGSAKRLLLRCFPSKYRLRQRKKTTFEVFSIEILTQAAQKDYFWGVSRRFEKRVFVTIISEHTNFLESILRNVFTFFLRRFSLQNLKRSFWCFLSLSYLAEFYHGNQSVTIP